MAKGFFTRTIKYANAYAWVVDGRDENGRPNLVKTDEVEFVSTSPNKAEAYKALRDAGKKVSKDMVDFTVAREEIRGMSFEVFSEHSQLVERSTNGKVKVLEDWDED